MEIKSRIEALVSQIDSQVATYDYAFVSLGQPDIKAVVKLIKNTRHLEREVIKQCEKFKKQAGKYPEWIKLDVVTETESVLFDDIVPQIVQTRRNYIDYGIALDKLWNMVFLPEEINANAFVRPEKKDKSKFFFSEVNVNNYLKKYTNQKRAFKLETYRGKRVTKFYTEGAILDGNEVFRLHGKGFKKNLRYIEHLPTEIDRLIEKSSAFLQNMLTDSGKYNYGYFPHFDKNINFYNILRHSSSTYALIEGLSYQNKDITPTEKAIDYVINHCICEDSEGCKYVYDDTKNINEIKLGQNAAFIFAVCEYLKQGQHKPEYLKAAQDVALGTLKMINTSTGETVHILNYPDLSVKEKYRIVYYDGEVALALLRLYQIDNNEKWLNTVKTLFEYFIQHDYWKYHDHWLGYCTNELVQIAPEEKYYRFELIHR